jgi:hypothetical protein
MVDAGQRFEGYRAALLNAHPSTFLRSVLYSIWRASTAAPGEPRPGGHKRRVGRDVNQQRFNKDFAKTFGTEDGIRFKSSNRSRLGSLSYLGDDVEEYRKWYEIQSPDLVESWRPLMNVTRVLAQTPPDRMKAALEPIFNVDGALRYLALDMVMMSGDGYWLHGSDYNLYVDPKGVLHILHHDTNEAFTAQRTAPAAGGRGGANAPLDARADPLGYMDDPNKALRNKLLVVPEYRAKYLQYVRDIARDALDWAKLGPKVEAHRALIRAEVEADTRKIYSTAEFTTAVFGTGEDLPPATTLEGFIRERRAYLLAHPEVVKVGR